MFDLGDVINVGAVLEHADAKQRAMLLQHLLAQDRSPGASNHTW